jgi:hypothetical protein
MVTRAASSVYATYKSSDSEPRSTHATRLPSPVYAPQSNDGRRPTRASSGQASMLGRFTTC